MVSGASEGPKHLHQDQALATGRFWIFGGMLILGPHL